VFFRPLAHGEMFHEAIGYFSLIHRNRVWTASRTSPYEFLRVLVRNILSTSSVNLRITT
jgi:hypothetical protein